MIKLRTRFLAALALSAVALPFAAPVMAEDTGFYVVANAGRVLSSYKRKDIDGSVTSAFDQVSSGFSLGPTSVNKNHVMWSAGVGYMLSRNFGIEASYLHLGALRYSAYATEAASDGSGGTSLVATHAEFKVAGPALAAVGALPLSNVWEVDARAGAFEGKTTSTYSSAIGEEAPFGGRLSKTSTSLLVGVGTGLTLTTHCVARLDYIRIQKLDDQLFEKSFNVDLLTVGLAYVF